MTMPPPGSDNWAPETIRPADYDICLLVGDRTPDGYSVALRVGDDLVGDDEVATILRQIADDLDHNVPGVQAQARRN